MLHDVASLLTSCLHLPCCSDRQLCLHPPTLSPAHLPRFPHTLQAHFSGRSSTLTAENSVPPSTWLLCVNQGSVPTFPVHQCHPGLLLIKGSESSPSPLVSTLVLSLVFLYCFGRGLKLYYLLSFIAFPTRHCVPDGGTLSSLPLFPII